MPSWFGSLLATGVCVIVAKRFILIYICTYVPSTDSIIIRTWCTKCGLRQSVDFICTRGIADPCSAQQSVDQTHAIEYTCIMILQNAHNLCAME